MEEQSETQAIEGYGCICGFKADDKQELTKHLVLTQPEMLRARNHQA